MKKNINQVKTIDSISLGGLHIENLFSDLKAASFQAQFFLGNEKGDEIGRYIATPENFEFSEATINKLQELVFSIENDMAISLFKEDAYKEVKEEKEEEVHEKVIYDADPHFII